MSSGNVAGILLAAGEGSRLGQPKALIELGGQSLVRRGIALLRDGGANPVIVVTGATSAAGRTWLAALATDASDGTGPTAGARGVISVHNPDWRTGMGSSLAAASPPCRLNARRPCSRWPTSRSSGQSRCAG